MKTGEQLGPFAILRPLGAGGMGEVFLARDTRLERMVAIKFSRQKYSERLGREARLASAVRHRSACQLLDIGEWEGNLYLVMEYVEGETLGERLRRGPMGAAEAVTAAIELLGVLTAMHGQGLIHRDLKPGNIMMTADGVRLIDFGLAAERDGTMTAEGLLCGTPGYISPEQIRGEAATPQSDLFAMGAILFEMITGTAAFPGPTMAARLTAVLENSPSSVDGPAELDGLIRRALAKTPGARFASASEFAEALRQVMAPGGRGSGAGEQKRIIVLPFRALRADPETDFLTESLPEAITSELAAFPGMQVRSSMVGLRYGGAAPDLRAIAAEAAVDIAVTGTLVRVKDQIRVSTQLLAVPAGTVLATSTFQSSVDDLFALQDQAVERIVAALGPRQETAEPRRDVAKAGRGYELYLRANLAAQDRLKMDEARDLYLQCLELDPEYAPAWARLGRCYRVAAKYLQKPAEGLGLAKSALERAVGINPELDLAQSMYAQLETDLGAPVEALQRLLEMGKRNWRSMELLAGLTLVCRFCGLLDESASAHRMARRLDPTAKTSVMHTYFHKGEHLRCLETAADGLGYAEAVALEGLGQTAEAIRRTEERLGVPNSSPLGVLLLTSLLGALKGGGPGARGLMEEAKERFWLGPEETYYFARQVIRAGDVEWGLGELDAAVRGGYYVAEALEGDPWLEGVRGRAGFGAMVEFARREREKARAVFVAGGGAELVSGQG